MFTSKDNLRNFIDVTIRSAASEAVRSAALDSGGPDLLVGHANGIRDSANRLVEKAKQDNKRGVVVSCAAILVAMSKLMSLCGVYEEGKF